jgi:hypothetical protein
VPPYRRPSGVSVEAGCGGRYTGLISQCPLGASAPSASFCTIIDSAVPRSSLAGGSVWTSGTCCACPDGAFKLNLSVPATSGRPEGLSANILGGVVPLRGGTPVAAVSARADVRTQSVVESASVGNGGRRLAVLCRGVPLSCVVCPLSDVRDVAFLV